MAAAKFSPASEVEKIAKSLIPEFHPHLVENIRVDYVFTDKTNKRGSKEVWGTMRKVSALNAYLASDANSQKHGATEAFFVMVISEPVWNNLNDQQKKALVDHELCHAKVDVDDEGNYKLKIVPHDMEEFTEIVKRHGLWAEDVAEVAAAINGIQQHSLHVEVA